MKTIHKTSKFKKDFKQYKNDNKVKIKLDEALSYLECGKELPASFKNHPLQGKYKGSFDCHLYPDVVLIYAISNDSISLSRIGKHNKLELTETLKLHIREEFLNGVDYLFRGESNNNYQQNYSKKVKLPFTSRFYAYEIFEGIPLFGNVAVYELSNSANMWNYDDSVESFIEEFDLLSYAVPELYKVYKITTLSELKEYGGTITFDYHDFYHAHQLVAIAYLENNYKTKYD